MVLDQLWHLVRMGGQRNWEGGCGGPWKAVTSVVGLRGRPLDDGAGVVGVGLLPWRSMHVSDRGGAVIDDEGGGSSTTRERGCVFPL
jgi:hypothetical protein